MKKIIFTLFIMVCFVASNFAVNKNNWKMKLQQEGVINFETPANSLDEFLALTPSAYKKATGEKLGLKKSLQLKAAQRFLKKNMNGEDAGSDIPLGLYIVLAIFGFAWIAMGVMDDWSGNNWWVNLLLSLCWIPGLIHALIKKNEYY